jgi:integrase
MSRSSDPRKQYLKQRRGRWFLNFPVPADVQPHFLTKDGKPVDHIVRTTGTGDLNEASRRKFGMIHVLQAEFTALRRSSTVTVPKELTAALSLRTELEAARTQGDHDRVEVIEMVISDQFDRIAEEGGATPQSTQRAANFAHIATGSETLSEAFDEWEKNSNMTPRTAGKRRTALDEFCRFLGGTPLVADMNRTNAIRYVDWLNREARSLRTKKLVPLAYNTKRDRVADLGSFWGMGLSARNKVGDQGNPWARLVITEAPTVSDVAWTDTRNTGKAKRREAFEESDLIAIMDAPGPRAGATLRYSKRTVLEVFTLAVLTGARPDEVCSLVLQEIRTIQDGYLLHFTETKTKDDRKIPVVHPVAVALLKRRINDRTEPEAQLFEEFRPKKGGTNMYELVGRALNRHLDRATGLPAEAVPYAARHTFATWVGHDMTGITDHALKRYIGHKPEGMTDKHYRSVKPEALVSVAKKVTYPAQVEARMREELGLSETAPE